MVDDFGRGDLSTVVAIVLQSGLDCRFCQRRLAV